MIFILLLLGWCFLNFLHSSFNIVLKNLFQRVQEFNEVVDDQRVTVSTERE